MWDNTFVDLAGVAGGIYHTLGQQHIHAAKMVGADGSIGVIGYETFFEILDKLIERGKEKSEAAPIISRVRGEEITPEEEPTDDETED